MNYESFDMSHYMSNIMIQIKSNPSTRFLDYFKITNLRIRLLRPAFRKNKKHNFKQLHYAISDLKIIGMSHSS